MKPKIYIILVNYNGWEDTIECLESIYRNSYFNFQVIVVDNGSKDGSIHYIKEWSEGRICTAPHGSLRKFSLPPVRKPIHVTTGSVAGHSFPANINSLVLIESLENKGFAAGNNIGIKYAMEKQDCDFIWLLNNDTVIEENTLKALVDKFESINKSGKKIGILGSKILYYDQPEMFQGVGARFNKWTGYIYLVGKYETDVGQYDKGNIKFEYIFGASMFMPAKFIEEIGLMCEDYFLFFEELDWAQRGRNKNWEISYCYQSKVFHKQGGSTGHHGKKNNHYTSHRYGTDSLFLYYHKFHKNLWMVPYFRLSLTIVSHILKGKFSEAFFVFKTIVTKKV